MKQYEKAKWKCLNIHSIWYSIAQTRHLDIPLPQDEIARIRKRKRSRNMLNRSGNTTDNLCFRYRFRDVFSRFRCCVYNGTGPLLRKHNGNMKLHVSATFPFTDSCNFVLCYQEIKDGCAGYPLAKRFWLFRLLSSCLTRPSHNCWTI